MATRSGKGIGSDLRTYSVFDFRKGLDLKTSPLQLAVQKGQNALRKADNCVYTSSGGVTKRFDQTTITASSVGASVAITGGMEYVHSNGTRAVYFGTTDGRIMSLTVANGATANAVTGLTANTRHYFDIYNNKLIWCNRADAPQKYDGTSWGALGGTPPATGGPVGHHGNRVFFFNATNTSQIHWSALNNEENYTAANDAGNMLVNANDGAALIAMVPSINELVLLKGSRPYRLQGSSPTTFALTDLVPSTGGKGAISPQGAVFAINDVWYMTDNGIMNLRAGQSFGDLKASYASDKISPYWELGNSITLSLESLASGVAFYDSQNNRLYFAVPSADAVGGYGTTLRNDTLLVLDLNTNGWSVWTGQSIASMWSVYNSTTGATEVYAGGYDGNIRILNRDVSTNAFTGTARHLSALGSPGIQKSPRHVYLYLKEDGNYTVSVDTKFDFGATGGQTYTASLLGGSHTLGVNWVLGTDPLGSKEQIVKRVDVAGVGEFLELGVSNANAGQPFTWYGYEVLWRPRRLVRPSTAAN